jgi:phage host-nuclease inhibitor protein Gam
MEKQLVNADWMAIADAAAGELVDLAAPPAERGPFEVHDYGAANWCLRKIERIEGRCAARAAAVEAECRRLREWAERENARERESADFLAAKLEPWARGELDGQRRRSIGLPDGTVGFRSTPGRVEVTDEAAALAYCEANLPEAVKVKKSISKSEIAEKFKKTGELPVGCEWAAGEERFYVKTGSGEGA